MKVVKLFGFGSNSPFKSKLFNIYTSYLFGKDGLLSEINIEQKSNKIIIKNLFFVHKGILIKLEEPIERTIPEKYINKSCVLVASVSDNTENSDIVFDFISIDDELQSRVIIARYDGIEWFSEEEINSNGIIKRMEEIFKTLPISFNKGLNISIQNTSVELSPGEFLNKEGKLISIKKKRNFILPKIDEYFPNRMDVIVYKKGLGITSNGSFNLICGPTISGLPNAKNSSNPKEIILSKGISSLKVELFSDDTLLYNYIHNSENHNNLTIPFFNNFSSSLDGSFENLNPSTSIKVSSDIIYSAYYQINKGLFLAKLKHINNEFKKIYNSNIIPNNKQSITSVSLEIDRFNNNYVMYSIHNEFKNEYYLSVISSDLSSIIKNQKINDNAYNIKYKIDSQIKIHIVSSSYYGLKYNLYSISNNNLIVEKELIIDNKSKIFDINLISEIDPIICFVNEDELNIYNVNTSQINVLKFDYRIIKLDFEVNNLGWLHFLTCDDNNTIRQFDYSLLNKRSEIAIYSQTENSENQIYDIKIAKENHGSLSIIYSTFKFDSVKPISIKTALIGENTIDGRKILNWQALISKNEFNAKNICPSSGDFLKLINGEITRIIKVVPLTINTTAHYLLHFDCDKYQASQQNVTIEYIRNTEVLCKITHLRLPGLGSYVAEDFFRSESSLDIIHSVIERQNNTLHKRPSLSETKIGNRNFFKYAYNKDASGTNTDADQTNFSDIGVLIPDNSCTKAVSIPVELLNKKNISVTVEILDENSLPQNSFNCLPKITLDTTTYGIGWEFSHEKNSILITFFDKPCFEKTWSDLKEMGIKYRVLFVDNSE